MYLKNGRQNTTLVMDDNDCRDFIGQCNKLRNYLINYYKNTTKGFSPGIDYNVELLKQEKQILLFQYYGIQEGKENQVREYDNQLHNFELVKRFFEKRFYDHFYLSFVIGAEYNKNVYGIMVSLKDVIFTGNI